MRSILEDTIAAIPVRFTDGNEPFVPVSGSAKWALRGHDGALLLTNQAISLGSLDVETLIQVPADQQTIDAAREFDKRTLIVTALRGVSPWELRVSYRVTPWINHTVTIDTVRGLAGLSSDELTPDDIDIYAAYKWLEDKIQTSVLETALASGTKDEIDANLAIASYTLLQALPAVANRLMKRRADGSMEAERFQADMPALRDKLQANIDAVVANLSNVVDDSPVLFSFGTPTDVITGT